MDLKLVSHISGDGDIVEAWIKYYLGLGVTSFHLVVHGSLVENSRLLALRKQLPVVILDSYGGEFSVAEKKRWLDSVLATMPDQWLLVVDSDEFVEFPYRKISTTIRMLEFTSGNILSAPMLQHMTVDGSLSSPANIENPFHTFPLCSVSLYEKMGSNAFISKHPLFYCTKDTILRDGGCHSAPLGAPPVPRSLLGVTHHFKFRNSLLQRLDRRIHSSHEWRHESIQLKNYLMSHDYRLPLDDSFTYSRHELFRRRLLQQFTLRTGVNWLKRKCKLTSSNKVPQI